MIECLFALNRYGPYYREHSQEMAGGTVSCARFTSRETKATAEECPGNPPGRQQGSWQLHMPSTATARSLAGSNQSRKRQNNENNLCGGHPPTLPSAGPEPGSQEDLALDLVARTQHGPA